VKGLEISFLQYERGLKQRRLKVINQMDLELKEGEILAVVGSSGSGKSLLADAVFGLLPANARCEGSIYYKGKKLSQRDKESYRGNEWALIPQSVNYLDPLLTVEYQIALSIKNKKEKDALIDDLMQRYQLPKAVRGYYPHQLSGGMARKVLLSCALASNAELIIADEPTPGLDAYGVEEVLHDFQILVEQGCSILMITHDIQAALKIADRVAIFYAGTTLEVAEAADFDGDGIGLRHPYTRALNDARPNRKFIPIPGVQPCCGGLTLGCLFCERCSCHKEKCETVVPDYRELREGKVRCHYAS